MKYCLYLLLSLWTLSLPAALAADTAPRLSLSVEETQPGTDWTLAVAVDNADGWNATAFQFDLTLPAGVHYADATVAATDRLADHVLYASTLTDGTLRIIALSVANQAIGGTSGTLFTLGLHADEPLETGQYEVRLSQARLSLRDGSELLLGSATATFNVIKPSSYYLIFQADGAEVARYAVLEGSPIDSSVVPEAPDKEGHTFVEWSGLPDVMPAHGVTVEAVYEVNTYEIHYYLNDELFTTQTVAYGEAIVAPEVDESEYTNFSGWIDLPATMPAYDLDIYGQAVISSVALPVVKVGAFRVYTLDGRQLRRAATQRDALRNLPCGIYVVNGKKVAVH